MVKSSYIRVERRCNDHQELKKHAMDEIERLEEMMKELARA